MTQPQYYCREPDLGCPPFPPVPELPPSVPSYPSPGYSDFSGLPPSLFMLLLIGIVVWSTRPPKKKEEKKKSDEEKLFEAIGQYESNRRNQADGRRTQFIYTFKDPCMDECPPKKKEEEKKAD
jgi:hypothetical protein